jgi:hypothetical protein
MPLISPDNSEPTWEIYKLGKFRYSWVLLEGVLETKGEAFSVNACRKRIAKELQYHEPPVVAYGSGLDSFET